MNALELRRRTLGKGVYKKTVEGNPAIAQGSLARMYPGIKMQGWTEQAQYEGKNLLPVDVGQEFTGMVVTDSATFEEDGVHAVFESIVSGEARDIYMYGDSHPSVEDDYVEVPILTPGDYRLVNDNIGISLYVVAWRNGASVVLGYANNATTKITVQDGDKFRIFLRCNIVGDTDVKIHPMIVKEGEDTATYEPYTGGQPSPNPDYPQEIVSAGKYDEGSRKYQYTIKISDSEESPTKSQTVTLTSDRPLTKWDRLEKRDGVWGWVYKSAEVVLDGSEDEAWSNYPNFNGFLCSGVLDAIYSRSAGMCNQGAVNQDGSIGIPNTIWLGGNTNTVYFINNSYYNSDLEDEGLQNLKNHLAQSPAIIWYETAEETFVPLSESEQEALNALHTFRPTTVLSNDCECEMSLTYKTKKSLEVTT